jgi:hypothetical protein
MATFKQKVKSVSLIFAWVWCIALFWNSHCFEWSCGTALFSDGTTQTKTGIETAILIWCRVRQWCYWKWYVGFPDTVLFLFAVFVTDFVCEQSTRVRDLSWPAWLSDLNFQFPVLSRIYGSKQLSAHDYSRTLSSLAFAGTIVGMLSFG